MVDVFLIIVTVVAFIILLVAGLYLVVYYQHPDDKNESYAAKLVVILGFVLAGATVLMLPLDVANNEGYAGCDGYDTRLCGGLNMEAMWHTVFWLIPLWTFVLIPFSTFYYEADDGMLMAGTAYAPNPIKRSRFGQALCYSIFVILIVGIFFAVMYLGLSDTNIPVQQYEGSAIGLRFASNNNYYTTPAMPNVTVGEGNETTVESAPFNSSNLAPMNDFDRIYQNSVTNEGSQTIVLQVSVGTFYAGLMAWLGWFLFALFGGIGLIALPLDLILSFVNRPRRMDAVEFAEAQLSLRERTNELVDIGELIKIEREQKAAAGLTTNAFSTFSLDRDKRQAAKDERQAILGFKQAVYLLEQDVEDFQAISANYDTYNPIIPYINLLLGLCAIIISLFWFIHIIVYIYPNPPLAPFLNNYFKWFDRWFPLFGTLSVAIFVVYLLFAAIKGCFKFGIRFLFFHIHPMKVGKTYMSSFMFNIGLVLLCALPVVQFSQQAFADYAAFAQIRQLFGVQIQYLQFFHYFWVNNIFIYCFMALNVLTVVYLVCKPRDQSANAQALRDRLRAHRSSGRSSSGDGGGAGASGTSNGASGSGRKKSKRSGGGASAMSSSGGAVEMTAQR